MKRSTEEQAANDRKLDGAIRAILEAHDAAKRVGDDAKANLRLLPDECACLWQEATDFLSGRLRRCGGERGRQLGEEVASGWCALVAAEGLPNYSRTRSFRPFMKTALWRYHLKQQRREQSQAKHRPALYYAAMGRIEEESDTDADPFVRYEINAAIELALFVMNGRDRALLDLYASEIPTVEIAKLLKVSAAKWAVMAFRARARFVAQLRITCSEMGLPLSAFRIISSTFRDGSPKDRSAA